jgi:hypothetical protein
MNEAARSANPEACDKFRQLRQEYESALGEEALSQYGGAAALRQSIHQSDAVSASAHARERLITHYKGCPDCKRA